MNAPRASYADAGRAHRATLARAHALKLGTRELRVVGAVLVLTSSWSKLADTTTTREVAELAYGRPVLGWERERIGAALTKLDALGVFSVTRVGKGRGARLRLQLHPVATEETPTATVGVRVQKHPPSSRETPTVGVAHREGPRINLREATVKQRSSSEHPRLPELRERVVAHLESVGARVPGDEVTASLAGALAVVDWRVVDQKIGLAIDRGARSWPYFDRALQGLRAS
jgi:hypothetical protein